MTGSLRDWYLDTLGVVQYRRRDRGAEEIPFHVEPEAKPETPHAIARELDEPVPEAVPDVKERETITAASTPSEETRNADLIEPFRLACWQSGDDTLLFNPLPCGAEPTADEIALLYNLLHAVGHRSDSAPDVETIDWPLTPGASADMDGARSMLSVFLDARIRQRGVLWVLLMGELPTSLILPSGQDYEASLGLTEELAGGAKAIVIPSLQEMLQDPSRKRDTWRAIAHLAASR